MTCTSRIPVFPVFLQGICRSRCCWFFGLNEMDRNLCMPCHQAGFHKWLSYKFYINWGEPTNHPNYSVDFWHDGALFFWTVPKARSTSPHPPEVTIFSVPPGALLVPWGAPSRHLADCARRPPCTTARVPPMASNSSLKVLPCVWK